MKPFVIKNLKRNPDIIKGLLNVKDTMVTTKGDMMVMFPSRYVNKELATIGNDIKLISIFAIVDYNGNYAVMNVPSFITLTPNKTSEVSIDDVIYTVLDFDKGDIFTPNLLMVMNDGFVFNLFDEFLIHGNVPWFLNYDDLSNIFLNSKKYADSSVGNDPLTMEIIVASMARDAKDKNKMYRREIKSQNYELTNKPVFVALLNIYYSFNSTVSKIAGSYFNPGITSALVTEQKEPTTVEKMLRA